ncbi:MAG TPA: UbiA family prenyltransferase [Chitinophagales bacterium]|nr:UbiA family prenyltransferase [Chitinophagales bacterium]
MKYIQAIFYSNIFIAICGIAFYRRGLILYQNEEHAFIVSFFVFTSTLFTYLFIRLASMDRIKMYESSGRRNFLLHGSNWLIILTVLSAIATGILFFILPKFIQYVLIVPGVISVLYGLPVFKKNGTWKKLRDVGVSKIFMIAFVWAFTGAILPAIRDLNWEINWWLFAADFLFIFAITIPFDIKDLESDALHNVKTIPFYIGKELSYTLALVLLFIAGVCYAFAAQTLSVKVLPPLTIAVIITGILLYATRYSKNNLIYFGWIDGTILLQYLLLLSYQLVR